MRKRFSISSLILIIMGLLVISAILYYGASSLEVFFGIILTGAIIYIIGVIFSVIAFAKREEGLLKYTVVASLVIVIFLAGYITY